MTLERPDRPGVVLIQRRDREGACVLGQHGRDERDPGETHPTRALPCRPLGPTQVPGTGHGRKGGDKRQRNPAEAHPYEREMRGDDPDDRDPDEVGEAGASDEFAPGPRNPKQRQRAEPGDEHQSVRAEESGNPHRKR